MLEAPDILGARRVGRPSQEGRKGANLTYVVAPGALAQAAHRHVIEHPLAQRGNSRVDRQTSHGKFLSLKELHRPSPPQRRQTLPHSRYITAGQPCRASGFVQWVGGRTKPERDGISGILGHLWPLKLSPVSR